MTAVFDFSPAGNYYAPTTLTSLDFLYRRIPRSSREDCMGILEKSASASKPTHVMVGGVPSLKLVAGEAGMSKSVTQTAFATWRGGFCYLFEEELHLVGPGVEPGKDRQLSAREMRVLDRHLHAITKSVRFSEGGK